MSERREHQRRPLRLGLWCRKVGGQEQEIYKGCSLNVSTGGLFFEMRAKAGVFQAGQLLNLELDLPPTSGLLEFGGKVSTFARVVRVHPPAKTSASSACQDDLHENTVAVQFCSGPTLGP